MVITTCLPPARRGEDVDKAACLLNIKNNQPPFKWEVLYKKDHYSPILCSLLKSIKKLFGAVTNFSMANTRRRAQLYKWYAYDE
jgi:hypothetical protein